MMQVVPRIAHMRCTGWPMSWGLIVPPGLEPDGWCMPVCVLHAPLYVYHLYFSEKKGKRTAAKEKRTAARGKEQEKNRKKKDRGP